MSGTSKFYKQKKQVSYDNGATWQDVVPAQYQKGNLYELNSPDCGYEQLERWVNSGTTCSGASGYDKYYLQVKQTSTDGGTTWTTTSDTRLGTLIEANSYDCGYVSTTKFKATYSNSRTYSAECDSNTTLTSGETRPNGYAYSSMTEAEIGDCVTSIGYETFHFCSGLTSVDIPNSVTSINRRAFQGCSSLTSINIPNSITSIGSGAFQQCSGLTSVIIPSGVTIIEGYVFNDCPSLTSVTIPNGVTFIGEAAFYGCSSLSSVTIPNSVTNIGVYDDGYFHNGAFYGCSGLTSLIIPDSVTKIGMNTFGSCSSLTSCTIGSGVIEIGNGAFYVCSSLTSVTIPSGVTSIGDSVFVGCSGLTSVTILATTPPTLGTYAFTYNYPIYVPSGSVNAYKSASGWSTYASRIQAIP